MWFGFSGMTVVALFSFPCGQVAFTRFESRRIIISNQIDGKRHLLTRLQTKYRPLKVLLNESDTCLHTLTMTCFCQFCEWLTAVIHSFVSYYY